MNDDVGLAELRRVVESFLAAARGRGIAGLPAVLAPDAVRRADAFALPTGVPLEVRGARSVVEEPLLLTRNALAAGIVLVDGRIGLAVAPHGRLRLVLTLVVRDGRIAGYQVTGDPDQLGRFGLAPPPSRQRGQWSGRPPVSRGPRSLARQASKRAVTLPRGYAVSRTTSGAVRMPSRANRSFWSSCVCGATSAA
ncbi:hypothetical protein PV682_42365 [Streptomyces niveiscabiei]|uniref:hypothetical protein n=1 Tax=Streptomyces niveiscabiei TaxID=164115 RepID=UPI0029B7382F|nr:hypothetical protein [Streptomyces niveiscabiei]MDX3388039.1 hypothetical protein [Streptomyces niveiscabiei]